MPTDPPVPPLADWAERQVRTLAEMTGAPALHDLCGAGLLVERAVANGFRVPTLKSIPPASTATLSVRFERSREPVAPRVLDFARTERGGGNCLLSAGGGCHLLPAQDGWVALNLARPDDRASLPALFSTDLTPEDDEAIATAMAACRTAEIVARGREMGLAIASADETPASPAATTTTTGETRIRPARPPLVIDLSALWAGPLATHLLWLAGAAVVKVESPTRPDRMRDGDPALFALLNQGKANIALNLRDPADRDALLTLVARADIVVEAARPRALAQLGIDADEIVRMTPGLTWITITGHGVTGDAGDWVGFGDDCGVAGGLSAALLRATGQMGFVGDAIADPLTGLAAANAAWAGWASGRASRTILSMSGTIAAAIAAEDGLDASLRAWAATTGQPFPIIAPRSPKAPLAALGQDNAAWLPC